MIQIRYKVVRHTQNISNNNKLTKAQIHNNGVAIFAELEPGSPSLVGSCAGCSVGPAVVSLGAEGTDDVVGPPDGDAVLISGELLGVPGVCAVGALEGVPAVEVGIAVVGVPGVLGVGDAVVGVPPVDVGACVVGACVVGVPAAVGAPVVGIEVMPHCEFTASLS
eukprot:CAMPEP_0197056746 /NCGR_PEP_ID=MMETSP1384-20130603/88915_1 /TAXON_ID=29189 /ORGANISM="Ammonia sp." /LENGTH=164 /DNA_ID=CAMNT_0042490877 /DNA_START=140 /DNA_END=634 /DNA_ORIENTATION=-